MLPVTNYKYLILHAPRWQNLHFVLGVTVNWNKIFKTIDIIWHPYRWKLFAQLLIQDSVCGELSCLRTYVIIDLTYTLGNPYKIVCNMLFKIKPGKKSTMISFACFAVSLNKCSALLVQSMAIYSPELSHTQFGSANLCILYGTNFFTTTVTHVGIVSRAIVTDVTELSRGVTVTLHHAALGSWIQWRHATIIILN